MTGPHEGTRRRRAACLLGRWLVEVVMAAVGGERALAEVGDMEWFAAAHLARLAVQAARSALPRSCKCHSCQGSC